MQGSLWLEASTYISSTIKKYSISYQWSPGLDQPSIYWSTHAGLVYSTTKNSLFFSEMSFHIDALP